MVIEEGFQLVQREQMVKLGRTLYRAHGVCPERALLRNLRRVEMYLDNEVRLRFNEPLVESETGYVSVIRVPDLENKANE